ncbi:substrate-binding domain-containing protein [Kiritimatiellota bacterium B12222]|nr:substrate-binding domain-containing protein [Kiritimatiellota bacterium B12222]
MTNLNTFSSQIDRSSTVPPYQQLKQILISEIETLGQDARLPADRSLAKGYGLSLVTVQKVMSELANEGYIQREVGRGSFVKSRDPVSEEVDTYSNPLLRAAIIYPNVFSAAIMEQLNKLEREGLKERITYSHFKLHSRRWLDRLGSFVEEKKSELDAIILIPPSDLRSQEQLLTLESFGINMVVLSACDGMDLQGLKHVRCCGMDRYAAGKALVEKCSAAGYQEILHVRNEPRCYDTVEFNKGLLQGAEALGMSCRTIADPPANWEDSGDYALRIMTGLAVQPSDSKIIVFDSAAGASAGIHVLISRGFSVPEEVSVVSGDFNESYRFYNPPLSGIRQDSSEVIQKAISVLTDPEAQGLFLTDPVWFPGGSMRRSL